MNAYLLTFTDGTTKTIQADDYRRLDGLVSMIVGRDYVHFVEANLRSFEKVSR